jgi:hypothetical protein
VWYLKLANKRKITRNPVSQADYSEPNEAAFFSTILPESPKRKPGSLFPREYVAGIGL